VALGARRRTLHLPLGQGFEQAPYLACAEPSNKSGIVSSVGNRSKPGGTCRPRSQHGRLAWAKRLALINADIRNIVKVAVGWV